ncbi:MAG: hypothetical protein RR357_00940 [Clostridia bacterium]
MNKKSTFKWLAITLLLGICVFSYAMLTKIQNQQKIPPQSSSSVDAKDETPVKKPDENLPKPPENIYNVLPRNANIINEMLVQNIGGADRETLRAVHNLGNYAYVIFDTVSNSFDIKSTKKSVAIAQLDGYLKLVSLLVLSGSTDETFSSSKVTSDGILIATSGEKYTKIYQISYALEAINQIQFESSNASYMYLDKLGTYLFMSQDKKLSAKLLSNTLDVKSTSSVELDNPKLLEVFPSANGFTLYVNGADYYGNLEFSNNGGFVSQNIHRDKQINSIYPCDNDGQLGFIALCNNKNSFSLLKLDKNLNIITSKSIGRFEVCFMYPVGENFFVYTSGDSIKTMLFCKHLDKVMQTNEGIVISTISNFSNKDGYLTINAHTPDNELYILQTQGGKFEVMQKLSASASYTTIDASGALYFSSALKQGIFINNFGNYDIFIARKTNLEK